MDPAVILALHLVRVTGPEGQAIDINPAEIVTVRPAPMHGGEAHFHAKVKCLIHTVDGKFVAVMEDCKTVRDRLEDAKE